MRHEFNDLLGILMTLIGSVLISIIVHKSLKKVL